MITSMSSSSAAARMAVRGLPARTSYKALADALAKEGHIAVYGIYFATDHADLESASEATLQQILALMKADPKLTLEVQGHTDNTGTHDHNQALSEQRAAPVVAWLVKNGVAAARLTSAGYADSKPVGDNTNAQGRALNRRVELKKTS